MVLAGALDTPAGQVRPAREPLPAQPVGLGSIANVTHAGGNHDFHSPGRQRVRADAELRGDGFRLLEAHAGDHAADQQEPATGTSTSTASTETMDFQLFDNLAPNTTAAIESLVNCGFYNGRRFTATAMDASGNPLRDPRRQ